MPSLSPPFIVGIGGSPTPGSSTERSLDLALAAAAEAGAEVRRFGGEVLTALPHYLTPGAAGSPDAAEMIAAIRAADGLIVASPGYHGSISGMIKNALDYVEDTAKDPRPYLDGRAVGCIACAYGWQATGSTLIALRTIVHALRGWPTPLGVAANTTGKLFTEDGGCTDPGLAANLGILAAQVMHFVRLSACLKETA